MAEIDQDRKDTSGEGSASKRGLWAFLWRKRQQNDPADSEVADPVETAPQAPTRVTRVGQLLREAREAKKIDLEQVEQAIHIRARYLEALELGQYDLLPTPGHVFGFLRNYAVYLGLDWAELEALHAKEHAGRRHLTPEIFHPKDIGLAPHRIRFKADLVLLSVLALVAVALGGWAFWQYGRPWLYPSPTPTPTQLPTATRQTVTAKAATTTPQPATITFTPESVAVTPTSTPTRPLPTPTATLNAPLVIATPTPRPTETPTPTPTRAGGVSLSIKVIERAWMQVTLDGRELPGGFWDAGDEESWEATNAIYFICGNAGGVEVTVNGQELGLLGNRGQVVEKTWTPQGEATPTPPSTSAGENTPTPTLTPQP